MWIPKPEDVPGKKYKTKDLVIKIKQKDVILVQKQKDLTIVQNKNKKV